MRATISVIDAITAGWDGGLGAVHILFKFGVPDPPPLLFSAIFKVYLEVLPPRHQLSAFAVPSSAADVIFKQPLAGCHRATPPNALKY